MYAQMHSHHGMYVLGASVYICIYWYVLLNAYMVDNDTSSNMIFILELCILFFTDFTKLPYSTVRPIFCIARCLIRYFVGKDDTYNSDDTAYSTI